MAESMMGLKKPQMYRGKQRKYRRNRNGYGLGTEEP